MDNTLYYGDNLPILREYIPDESVDLVYLDPPFNSNASYNVLFKEQSGEASPAQIQAFTDTWEWTLEAERTYREEIVENPRIPENVVNMVSAFLEFVGRNAMMAYLVMMAPRLVELRRVLKPTGSIYLHCDPTASHYLKLLMDAVFGKEKFRNEITWRRSHPKGLAFTRFASNHDVILAYASGGETTWNPMYIANPRADEQYSLIEEATGRRYQLTSLLNPNPDRPNLTYEFKGVTRVWRWTKARMEEADRQGLIVVPRSGQGVPRLKRYLDEQEGIPVGDTWDDIPIAAGRERLGYPTQKPQALLERIIQASSNLGDVVLDPFCGCGTAVAAAHKLDRRWIGIDVTHLAVALMKNRLKTAFNLVPGEDYQVVGEPVDVGSARALADQDPYQFQFWAVSLLEALPREQGKKGADRGIDGIVYFLDGPKRTAQKAIVQVKSGKVSSPHIRDLKGTLEREKAALGLFITLEEPTSAMRAEALSAGFYHSDVWQRNYPKVQILTVGELLAGVEFEVPRHPSMYQAARRERPAEGEQQRLIEASAVYTSSPDADEDRPNKPDHELFAELRDEVLGDRTLPGNSADWIREAREIRDAQIDRTLGGDVSAP